MVCFSCVLPGMRNSSELLTAEGDILSQPVSGLFFSFFLFFLKCPLSWFRATVHLLALAYFVDPWGLGRKPAEGLSDPLIGGWRDLV